MNALDILSFPEGTLFRSRLEFTGVGGVDVALCRDHAVDATAFAPKLRDEVRLVVIDERSRWCPCDACHLGGVYSVVSHYAQERKQREMMQRYSMTWRGL